MTEPRDQWVEARPPTEKSGPARLALLAFAVPAWVAASVVLLRPISGGQKLWVGTASLVAGGVAFRVSAAVLGREVFRRYRERLDPRRPWRRG